MTNRRGRAWTLVAALAVCLFASVSDAVVRVRITRNAELHAFRDAAVTSPAMVASWGGVVLQASATFAAEDEGAVAPGNVSLGPFDAASDRLCVRFAERCYFLSIDELTLARLFSWIDNGGTGVYSVWCPDDAAMASAGLTPSRYYSGCLAKEFAGTPIEEIAHHLDFFPDAAEAENREAVLARLNRIESWDPYDFEDESWIVSDVDSIFTVSLRDGAAEIAGTVYRYHNATLSSGDVVITDLEAFRAPPPSARAVDDSVHARAAHFVRVQALLRAIHVHNSASWNGFAASFFDEE